MCCRPGTDLRTPRHPAAQGLLDRRDCQRSALYPHFLAGAAVPRGRPANFLYRHVSLWLGCVATQRGAVGRCYPHMASSLSRRSLFCRADGQHGFGECHGQSD